MFRRFFAWVQRYERHLSALATLAGVVVDQIFFERVDLFQTQAVFAAYALICFTTIPLMHRIEARAASGVRTPRWRALLPIATQFALGGFWSGFLVFYGRSAVASGSWPFLAVLVAIIIGNEVFARYHDRLVFTSVLFFFALYSYAIFAVPIYMRAIGVETFLLSGAVAISVFALFTMLLRALGSTRFAAAVWRIRAGAAFVLVTINLFYFTNILPPLPLSVSAAGVYHAVWRVPGAYLATSEGGASSILPSVFGGALDLHVRLGDPLFAYASVFAPTALATVIIHQWQWYDPAAKKWQTLARVAYPILGGRDGGYRGYSTITVARAGSWRVNIETEDGRLIARLPFTAIATDMLPALAMVLLP